jgi:hypothetical protein
MSYGAENWQLGDTFACDGDFRTAQTMRFYALGKMLDAGECAARLGHRTEAVEHLRELQAYCERMIGMLAPEEKARPRVVTAA